ncbi:DEAD/DEAH box helicase family protein [Brachybacterium sp. JHP9]|uniref:DEAD/DEAH box helicase family protein n=1 Tax=Brachybacterium equifaecis TaxID=2910770 RepID=A0ABT0R1N3_9MICO|nr:DEAD/DEAH box helicase family protein [Brachybacterium equifaecis]
MPIDLKRLGNRTGEPVTNPRDIFDALPNTPWPRLRLEQGEVLKVWHDQKRAQRDVVIKQNTGGGKTVVGLLIAQSSLNEGVGPAVYLAPDTYLASQVLKEASALGIAAVDDFQSEDFRASKAILVTTLQKLVNGRSVFGVVGGARPTVPLGVVVVDDAHSALAIAKQQFTVTIPRAKPVYRELLDVFAESLKEQSASAWHAIDGGFGGLPLRVPFWTWTAQQDRVRALLDPLGRDQEEKWIYFSWPLTSPVLDLCTATVTSDAIEIAPPCAPIELIPSFRNATRRVYLTATLSDDGVLVTDLAADPADVLTPVTPDRAADLGDRLILAPLALNPSLGEDAVREMVKEFSRGQWVAGGGENESQRINVIVLVPSDKRATEWAPYADHTYRVGDLDAAVDRLKAGEWLGVVVLVNKYDGVDLPDDACRLLVIDGVPFPLSPGDARAAAALAGTDTFAARQTQRIEQGMGRGIRDAEDHCAVLLLGSTLALSLRSPAARQHYSPATRAQINLSLELAGQIQGEGLSGVRDALILFLSRDSEWRRLSRAATAGVEYDRAGRVTDVAIARRKGFDLARAGRPHDAEQTLTDGIRALKPYERGWYQEEAAAYAHRYDPDRAQTILQEARLANINVMMPVTAIPVRVLRPSTAQANAASAYLTRKYASGVELVLAFTTILDAIVYDRDRVAVDAAEQAFEDLGFHLGFEAERPDKRYNTGPDGIWSVSDTTQLLIELKTGVHRDDARIIKSELDQASGHINWHRENYGADCTAVSILVHPSRFYDPLGTPAPNTVVLEQAVVDSIRERVLTFARAIAVGNNWTSVDAVKQHLIANNLVGRNALTYQAPSPEPSAAFVLNPHSEQAKAAERARREELDRAAEEGSPGVQDAGETPTESSDAPRTSRQVADRD